MTNPNEPIRPHAWKKRADGVPELNCEMDGLTKREYFAAMAMQGILSNNADENTTWDYEIIGEHSTMAADALIKALNQ